MADHSGLALRRGSDSPHPCHWLFQGWNSSQLLQEAGCTGGGNRHIDIQECTQTAWPGAWLPRTWLSAGRGLYHQRTGGSRTGFHPHPSPNVAANHQYYNALVLAKRGAAILIEEKDLAGELLCQKVGELVDDPGRLRQLGENAQRLAILDANQRIYQEIMALFGPLIPLFTLCLMPAYTAVAGAV